MAARRVNGDHGEMAFDHGAQYFTARDPRFIRYVDSWIEQNRVAKWPDLIRGNDQRIVVLENGKIKSESNSDDRFVAVPTMNSICKHLANDLEIVKQTRVAKIDSAQDSIEIVDDEAKSLGVFDRLIVSAPAEQSAELLANFPALVKFFSEIKMNPCWATMVAFKKPLTDQWVGAFLHDSFLSWAARNSTKPGRSHEMEQLIIHANPEWTAEHWEKKAGDVAELMLAEFWRVAGVVPQKPAHLQAHRWKYAIPVAPGGERYFSDESAVITTCGDWASDSRVEGAFLSGMSAAGRILGTLQPITGLPVH